MRMVLETLRHYQLFAKASKCQFGRSSVGFLGHVISERGVGVDPAKVEAIREWARPSTCTDVRRFVGLANYYRRFVPRFSDIAAPLTALCSPRASFVWAAAEQPIRPDTEKVVQISFSKRFLLRRKNPKQAFKIIVAE